MNVAQCNYLFRYYFEIMKMVLEVEHKGYQVKQTKTKLDAKDSNQCALS